MIPRDVWLAKKPRFIYFARRGPLVKIGISLDVKERMINLSRAREGHVAVLLAAAEGRYADEQATHAYFRKYRSRGEWFLPAREIFQCVELINEIGELPDFLRGSTARSPEIVSPLAGLPRGV